MVQPLLNDNKPLHNACHHFVFLIINMLGLFGLFLRHELVEINQPRRWKSTNCTLQF